MWEQIWFLLTIDEFYVDDIDYTCYNIDIYMKGDLYEIFGWCAML